MKPTGLHMQVFGIGLAHENLPSAKPLAPGFSFEVFPFLFFFANFLLFHLSYFPTSWMLPQGCEEPLILTMDRP